MFRGWDSFFQITGEAGATLIGLLFLVVSFSQNRDRSRMLRAASIYLTPTALHFAIVLTISTLAVAPRLSVPVRAAVMLVAALTGLGNGIWACIGMRSRTPGAEPPHWSDFWLYGAAPTAVYLGLTAAAVALAAGAEWSVHAMAAFLLILLLIGIRNAWDLVTWMAPIRSVIVPDAPSGDQTSSE